MECLAPAFGCDIFMDNNYRAIYLLTHTGVNKIWATELDYANATNGEKKRKVAIRTAHIKQIKSIVFLTVVG